MRRVTWPLPAVRRAGGLVLGALLLAGVAACGADDPVGPAVPTSANQVIGTKLAALAIVIATGSEGSGARDNFLGCTRRGVIAFSNTAAGRRATVSGCNLGDSVVADGEIEARWVGSDGARSPITRIELVGPITVKVGDTTRVVPSAVIENISFANGAEPSLASARLHEVRITLLDESVGADPRALFQNVFGPFPLTLNSIPNPTGSPGGLSEDDARRLALQLGTTFQVILEDESGRPPHQHDLGCGYITVTPKEGATTNVISFGLQSCDFGNGMLLGGSFVLDEADAVLTETSISYKVRGAITVGGGVARTSFSDFLWSASLPDGLPGNAVITMTLVTGSDRWEYSYTVPVDD